MNGLPINAALVRIVDDDEDLLLALAFMLKSEGWEVKTYNGSASFLAEDDISIPGCVILDYSMPGLDGLETQKRLQELNYPHPLIFLTAHADVDMVISAFRRGADDLLRKPGASVGSPIRCRSCCPKRSSGKRRIHTTRKERILRY